MKKINNILKEYIIKEIKKQLNESITDVNVKYQQYPELANVIEEVFNTNPQLRSLGTPEQYSQYLDTIFPDSKVKDIVYHGSKTNKIEGGKLRPSKEGVYGGGIYVQTKDYSGTFGSNKLLLLIDTKKPFIFFKENGQMNDSYREILEKWRKTNKYYFAEAAKEEFRDIIISQGYDSIKTEEGGGNQYYILFEPDQTHILGGEQDIEGFKNFVKK